MEYSKSEIKDIIRDAALAVQQSTKQEHSGLISALQLSIQKLEIYYEDIMKELIEIKAQKKEELQTIESLKAWKLTSGGWVKGIGISIGIIISLIVYIFISISNEEKDTQIIIRNHIIDTK